MIYLDRIDPAPISNSGIPTELLQWIWVLVDSLNETINSTEQGFNRLSAPSYPQADILSMVAAGQLVDGAILFDSTNSVYVGMIGGSLVTLMTGTYP